MSINVEQTNIICGTCGISYSMPKKLYNEYVEEGGFWTCPNGHKRGFNKGSKEADLEKANNTIQNQSEIINRQSQNISSKYSDMAIKDRTITALRGHLTRLKNKIAKLEKYRDCSRKR